VAQKHRLSSDASDPADHRLAASLVDISHHHRGALVRQCLRARRADTRRPAGDDRNFTLHLAHQDPPALHAQVRASADAQTSNQSVSARLVLPDVFQDRNGGFPCYCVVSDQGCGYANQPPK
jgi:hypothetical protein